MMTPSPYGLRDDGRSDQIDPYSVDSTLVEAIDIHRCDCVFTGTRDEPAIDRPIAYYVAADPCKGAVSRDGRNGRGILGKASTRAVIGKNIGKKGGFGPTSHRTRKDQLLASERRVSVEEDVRVGVCVWISGYQ